MAGANPRTAVQDYLRRLQQLIACVTSVPIQASRHYATRDKLHALAFPSPPVRLKGSARVALDVRQQFRIVERDADGGTWKVHIAAYSYVVEDANSREILAYHWHPEADARFAFPHLHIEHGSGVQRAELIGAHLPSGRIAVESVIRLLADVFGGPPLKKNCERILARAQPESEIPRTRGES